MKTIPMIFNQEMVKALIDGRKTVTRRPIKYFKDPAHWSLRIEDNRLMQSLNGHRETPTGLSVPFKAGDLIWVRETFCLGRLDEVDAEHPADRTLFVDQCCHDNYFVQKEWAVSKGAEELDEVKWKPSIHMPRKASRLTLRVTDVRCETVQQITEESAQKEGVAPAFIDEFGNCPTTPRFKNGFYKVWDGIYSNWDENPWVWVIEFEVIHKNVDEVTA